MSGDQAKEKKGLFGGLFSTKEPPPPIEQAEPVPEAEPPEPPQDTAPADMLPDTLVETPAEAPAEEHIESSIAEPAQEPVEAGEPESSAGWFTRLRRGLSKSSNQLGSSITGIFTKKKLDAATLEDLEDALLQADLGVETAMAITEALERDRYDKAISPDEVRTVLADEVAKVLEPVAVPLEIDAAKKPFVILVVGVNGAGKTTTIGKLSKKLRDDGRSVMLGAGDTFRAAAIEQIEVWGERTGARVVAGPQGSDAAGLAFDALKDATAQGMDVLLLDTAGRLQNRAELMAELEKIVRVIKKQDETAPHAVLLVLDATVGQNALQQAEIFGKIAGVTGIVMTKLDGTAKGGILVAIARKFGLPIHFVGVGEGVEDLQPFAAKDFASAIAGTASENA
ncbi:MAG: signal recognition particle-docking protein FtsY [Hyphomicrobiales bacterium]|nr:signal recognition particle-docking protein FtsY [Hyphomicrobiales bacterium]